MCGVFFPSCSSDCQERKTCVSSCNKVRLECGALVSQLDMIKPGGMLAGLVKSLFPKPKIYEIVQTLISSLSCNGDNFDSDEKQCAKVSTASNSCSAEMAEVKSTKPTAIRLFPTQEVVKREVKGPSVPLKCVDCSCGARFEAYIRTLVGVEQTWKIFILFFILHVCYTMYLD